MHWNGVRNVSIAKSIFKMIIILRLTDALSATSAFVISQGKIARKQLVKGDKEMKKLFSKELVGSLVLFAILLFASAECGLK